MQMLNLREQQELRFQKGNWTGDRNWSLVRAQWWWWWITWAQWNIQCVLLSAMLDGCQYLRAASLPAGKPSSGVQHQENLGAALGPKSEKLSRVAPTRQCYPTCPHRMRAHGRWWSENTGGHGDKLMPSRFIKQTILQLKVGRSRRNRVHPNILLQAQSQRKMQDRQTDLEECPHARTSG